MGTRRLIGVAVACAAGSLVLPAAGEAATCPEPAKLSAKQHTLGAVKVTWRRDAGTSYRVLRGTDVVGQTGSASMIVRAVPGRRIRIKVGVVGPGGKAPRCYRALRLRVASPVRLPAPKNAGVEALDARRVVVSWTRLKGAVGYRVLRDGKLLGTTRRSSLEAAVTPGASHAFRVAAIGRGDLVGKATAPVRFNTTVRGPGEPGAPSASVVTSSGVRLSWSAAPAGTFPIRGYRVYRDNGVVGQFTAASADVTGLATNREYEFAVAAVDTRGAIGPRRSLRVRTSVPAPTAGRMHAFVLASTDDSFRSLQRHYDDIGVIYPTYYDCDPANVANVRGANDALITQWAKERRILVLPRFNCQRTQTLRTIFADSGRRALLLSRLVGLAQQHDFDGINLDFEAGAPEDRDAMTAFVADLAAELHRVGRRLSVDVSPKVKDVPNHPRSTFFDYRAIGQYADWVWVMSWGLHWSTSAPGPIAPANWLRQVYDYVATLPNHDRFIMGLPLYGFDWPAGGGPANPAKALSSSDVQQLIGRYGAAVVKDPASGESTFTYTDEQGVGHQVWFGDAPSLGERFRIAGERGLGGIGVWRLGQEDQALWNEPLVAGSS